MKLDDQIVEQIKKKIATAKKTLLLAHKNPDGDTMGSALAMHWYLSGLGKEVDLGCFNAPARGLQFLPGLEALKLQIDESQYDLIISFDMADPKLSGFEKSQPRIFSEKQRLINVDHHPSNLMYAGINFVIPECASTTQILYYFMTLCGAVLTPEISTCLLTGLYTDTGSFMHQNTTSDTLRVGSDLVRHGAQVTMLSKHFFRTKPINQLKLWGKVFDRAKKTDDDVIVSAITQEDLKQFGVDKDHISGAIEFLKYVPGIRYAKILSEDEEGHVKGSLRTIRDDVDVSAIAGNFGGGGHVKAAGFSIPGKLKRQVRWTVIDESGEREVE